MSDRAIKIGFSIQIVEGDALELDADVLIVKDQRTSRGIDFKVRNLVFAGGADLPRLGVGEFQLASAKGVAHVAHVLVVGPTDPPLRTYDDIRRLAAQMLSQLKKSGAKATHALTTLQGVNRGLDEYEAFRAMLLGFSDAYEAGDFPATLRRITFADLLTHRIELMRTALAEFLPAVPAVAPSVERVTREAAAEIAGILAGKDSFAPQFQKPVADDTTPHVFVAMPFAEEYDDQFYLAIRPAVQEVGMLCVRLDQTESVFTGDIVQQIKERISSAKLVLALLDGANPNVYLEVGYAWGVNVPTVLIVHQAQSGQALPFDVRGQRCLIYDRIYRLKEMLTAELRALQ